MWGVVALHVIHPPIDATSPQHPPHPKSNLLSFIFGSLPNYTCYSNSVAYFKCGGSGELPNLIIVILTILLFFYTTTIIPWIPVTMASTLLIHVGLDLFLEGVRDSFWAGYDKLEYGSIWIIAIAMTSNGMTTVGGVRGLGVGVGWMEG